VIREKEMIMQVSKRNRLTTALVAAGAALVALMMNPVNAAAPVMCSSFDGGMVPAGNHDYNIIVDSNCSVSKNANVRGNLLELGDTPWSIFVDPEASIDGNIIERGPGFVWVIVGNGQLFSGIIREAGEGFVWVQVDGVFDGSVMEWGDGYVIIEVFGPYPAAGPGVYIGNASENDDGDAHLRIDEGGDYDGNFTEKGLGTCFINTVPGQPRGNIRCD
jgi:hypothetical protein